jgi:hypothetical protein
MNRPDCFAVGLPDTRPEEGATHARSDPAYHVPRRGRLVGARGGGPATGCAARRHVCRHTARLRRPGAAAATDPNLVNGWGLARSATSPWWVADNGTDRSTLYNFTASTGAIAINPLVVGVDGGPTGVVFAGVPDNFLVGTTVSPTTLAPANFVFSSEDGMIRAWRGGSAAALVTAHGQPGAIYKGLAIAQPTAGHPLLYAADFHNARVDVFDGAWQDVTPAGAFVDPMLPAGYAPFGIQTIGARVFVSYAQQDADAEDELAGQGRGFVDAYDLAGNLLERVAQHGQLNAPWGSRWPRRRSAGTPEISSWVTSATGRSTRTRRPPAGSSTGAPSGTPPARSS